MPITQSAKKAIRNSARKQDFNLVRKETMVGGVKKLKKLVASGNVAEAKSMLSIVFQSIDKAVKTNLIKKNTAARKKSRIAALIKKTEVKK